MFTLCWDQKQLTPAMPTDFFAFHALEILKHSKFAHFSLKNGCFLMFGGSQSHAFSCKHETHDLLTLASLYYIIIKEVTICPQSLEKT